MVHEFGIVFRLENLEYYVCGSAGDGLDYYRIEKLDDILKVYIIFQSARPADRKYQSATPSKIKR
jgi:hypothetical protein